ncbi:MAG: hypothetical protein IPK76_23840 [Lewinellaceae bacterium]|nr:hypothetical protein [Lewinellaceae bacterium]
MIFEQGHGSPGIYFPQIHAEKTRRLAQIWQYSAAICRKHSTIGVYFPRFTQKNPQIGADLAIFCSNLPETLYHRSLFPIHAEKTRRLAQIWQYSAAICRKHSTIGIYFPQIHAEKTRRLAQIWQYSAVNLPETLYHRSLFPADSRRKNPQIGADLAICRKPHLDPKKKRAIFCVNLREPHYHTLNSHGLMF